MKMKNESQVLDINFRAAVIEEIKGRENYERKELAYKQYECYRDRTKKHVLELLLKMFDEITVNEMQYAVANISIIKKIVNKLARVYSHGVTRAVKESEKDTETVQNLSKSLCLDTVMKTTNRFLKLQHNGAVYMRTPLVPGSDTIRKIIPTPLLSHQYDVIDDDQNPTIPIAVVLSYFSESKEPLKSTTEEEAARRAKTNSTIKPSTDGKDQTIADADTGSDSNAYVWWTNSYHFTTNCKGEIIAAPDQNVNPIQTLPFVFFSYDNDCNFWSRGGSDLLDNALTINSLLSHINHIAVVQGYGQFWMKGKELPQTFKTGPNKAILLKQAEGEPDPAIGFASSNPPIEALLSLLETQVALLLTTNDLSTSGVSTKLDSGTASSGVALLIDKSESIEDVSDQAQLFLDAEPKIFNLFRMWHDVLLRNRTLDDSQVEYKLPADIEKTLVVKIGFPTPMISEKEKLETIKMRKDIGVDSIIDSIMRDNPGMTEEEAKERYTKIQEYKQSPVAQAPNASGGPESMDGLLDKEDNEEEDQNDEGSPDNS